jgi:glycosyltransferase involved in cell wall biosynthesis
MSGMAPVVVFGYNRPDHLRQTLEHLAQADGASDSDLWIFCDGPKPDGDPARTDAVRALACDPVWVTCFASVQVRLSGENRGLATSIIGGVSSVIEGAGRVIVLEDDLLVAPDFLRFMNDCLDFYHNDQKVGSITGFSPLAKQPKHYAHDVMAVPRNCSHGWATWVDRWREVDWSARDATRLWRDKALRRRFNAAGNDRVDRLQRQLAGKIDSWSIRFGLWQTLSGRHTIYPVQNRVHNIGFDGSGVHTRKGQDVNADALTEARPYALCPITEDAQIIHAVACIYSGPWWRRAIRVLRSHFKSFPKRA